MTTIIWPRDDTQVEPVEEIEKYHSVHEPVPYPDHDSLVAQAIATILQQWHPNALHAFLDCETYSSFHFDVCDKDSNGLTWRTHSIWRRERIIRFGTSNQNGVWHIDCRYGVLDGSPWIPLGAGSMELGRRFTAAGVEGLANEWAKDQMVEGKRERRGNRFVRFLLNGSKVDSHCF